MARGAYHFFIATKNGKAQAEHFIKTVELQPGDLPPVLDVEATYGVPWKKVRERVKEWLTTVENYYGVKPIIYANVDFYQQVLKDEFDEYPLWVAHYLQKKNPAFTATGISGNTASRAMLTGSFARSISTLLAEILPISRIY